MTYNCQNEDPVQQLRERFENMSEANRRRMIQGWKKRTLASAANAGKGKVEQNYKPDSTSNDN